MGGLRISYSLLEGDQRFDDHVTINAENFDQLKNKQKYVSQEIEKSLPFLHAPTIKAGKYPVVMSQLVVGVFAHESFGHKSEADFMLGDENAKDQWSIGTQVGSDVLSITDCGEGVGTGGYCPIDDEGYPTQKTFLIENGVLKGRLHSLDTANEFDEQPTGNARAMDFEYEPIVRMTNTYVVPGEKSFEEMITSVKSGLYIHDFKHGSGLSTFTIAPLKSYFIKDGKIAGPVKISVISGDVFKTLSKIEDCSKEFDEDFSVFGGCGKNEQWPLSVGMGGGHVLISDMMVS